MNRESLKHFLREAGVFPFAQKMYWAMQGKPVPVLPPPPPPVAAQGTLPAQESATQDAQESVADPAYAARLAQEQATFASQVDVHALPEIFHYWSNKYLLPKCREFGFSHPDEHFANHLEACLKPSGPSRFVSIGAGNCDTEVRVAQLLRTRGHRDFVIECLEINPHMAARGRELAASSGVAENIVTLECDFNRWEADGPRDAIMANQSLHHVVELEHLFAAIEKALTPTGLLVISDTVGRNGHQRWPEALAIVQAFWRELPPSYRRNLQLARQEDQFMDWDCSSSGFEGIRAQDIMPLLSKQFHFHTLLPFANVIDPFIDRGFGHHFRPEQAWDRDFIDRVHARDEAEIRSGRIKPAHVFASLGKHPHPSPHLWAGLSPEFCTRVP